MRQIYIFVIIALGYPVISFAPNITITQPGTYSIGGSIAYDPGVTINDAIIKISSNDVLLDLSSFKLSQSGATAGLKGITVDAGLDNITIQNGIIFGLTGTGIAINAGCRNITIRNMKVDTLLAEAIFVDQNSQILNLQDISIFKCSPRSLFLGGSSGNMIQQATLDNILLYNCNFDGGGQGIGLDYVHDAIIKNSSVTNSGNLSTTFTAFAFRNCYSCNCFNDSVLSCSGSIHISYDVVSSTSCLFKNCISRNNKATVRSVLGFAISFGSSLNILQDCIVADNQATTTVICYRIRDDAQKNELHRCLASSNVGQFVFGYNLAKENATFNRDNSLFACTAMNNLATGFVNGDCIGFSIQGSDFGYMHSCVAAFNSAPQGSAVGLQFALGTGGSNWYIQDCKFVRNIGSADATSFGIRIQTGTTNWFINNIAFNNGVTANNQLNGLNAGATTNKTTSNTTTGSGWTNFQGIP